MLVNSCKRLIRARYVAFPTPFILSIFENIYAYASVLDIRHKTVGDSDSLERAISLYEKSFDSLPGISGKRPQLLHALGKSFHERYMINYDINDLNRAVETIGEACNLAGPDILRSIFLGDFAVCLKDRFELGHDKKDFSLACKAFRDSAKLAAKSCCRRSSPCLTGLEFG